jgi:hypothetical protein
MAFLPEEERPRLYVQMGSTLRNLKQFARAVALLQEGVARFPDFLALKAFLALAEYSSGERDASLAALRLLISDHGNDPSMKYYARALGWYLENISTFPG